MDVLGYVLITSQVVPAGYCRFPRGVRFTTAVVEYGAYEGLFFVVGLKCVIGASVKYH